VRESFNGFGQIGKLRGHDATTYKFRGFLFIPRDVPSQKKRMMNEKNMDRNCIHIHYLYLYNITKTFLGCIILTSALTMCKKHKNEIKKKKKFCRLFASDEKEAFAGKSKTLEGQSFNFLCCFRSLVNRMALNILYLFISLGRSISTLDAS
jgi:hypothetical protein